MNSLRVGPVGLVSGVDDVFLGVLIEISLVEWRGIERVEQLLGSAQPDFDAGGLLGRTVVGAAATAATGAALTDSKGALRIAKGPTSELSLYRRESFLMAVYMVERSLKGITMDQLGAAQKSAIETGKKMTASGKKVRYIRSTFVPDEARCMCLFEATGPELVKELNEEAKIPFTRIVEALDLTP